MNYVKKDFKAISYPKNLKQSFQNKFSHNATVEREIVKRKMAELISDEDVLIAGFVFEHVIVEEDDIKRVCKIFDKTEKTPEDILENLIKYRVLNRFILTDDIMHRPLPDDAKFFYTIDIAGKYLLDHYWKNFVDTWNTGTPGLGVEKIERFVLASKMHIGLLTSCPNKLKEFKGRTYRIGRDAAALSFEFRLEYETKEGIAKKYFIGDVIRKDEDEIEVRDRINFINSVCSTRAWQRLWPFSSDAPIVLFVVEDEKQIEEMVTILKAYYIPKFFITTDKEIAKGINRPSGVWKRYDDTLQMITDAKTKIFIDT